MTVTVGDAVVYYRGDNTDAIKSMDDTEQRSRGWASRVGGIVKTGMIAGTVAVVGLGAGLAKLAFDAMPLEGIQKAFDGITGGAKDTMLALRKGSLSMVKDADLMRNYNEAAQLVGKSFADQLPDAMKYLSKVSAATGQDMGYMMDSITKGVGRMSPMILDNLGIQVDLVSANEVYAKTLGKTTDELTKTEKQTALMNQVMEKLAENTKDMPDVTENAATKWAQLTTKFGNLKDMIGLGVLPIFTTVVTFISDTMLPTIERIGSFFYTAISGGEIFEDFFTGLPEAVEKPLVNLWEALTVFRREGLGGLAEHFWEWLTGEHGVINAGVFLIQHRFAPQISFAFSQAWPVIRDTLATWGTDFWDWLTGENGAISQASTKLNELSIAFAEWVAGPEAQEAMKGIGSEIGKALGNGVKWIFSPEGGESDAVMGDVGKNLLDAAQRNLDSFFEIGATIEAYMITGFIEALTGKAVADETAQKIKDVLKLIVKMTNPASIGIELFKGIWEPFQNAWNAAFAFLKGEPISYNLAEIAPFQGAGLIPSMAAGGTVPGPPGAAVPIMAHGQERIIPYDQEEETRETRIYITTLNLMGVQNVSSFLAELEALT